MNVTIKSQYNQGEFIDGLWAFSTDGQHSFYFYPTNMTWTVSHADAIRTMRYWENNTELVQSLRTLSMDYFSLCLMTYSTEMPGQSLSYHKETSTGGGGEGMAVRLKRLRPSWYGCEQVCIMENLID